MDNVDEQAPITELIIEWKKGNQSAFNELFTVCYQQFKHEVRKQRLKRENDVKKLDICIQTTTTIVHDGYLKLSAHRENVVCNRKDLYLLISQVVKSVIYDQYRKSSSQKRNPSSDAQQDTTEDDTSELHAKLLLADKSLTQENARCSDVLYLSVYAGLKPVKIANLLNISIRTVHNDLSFAKAWYLEELSL
ncbi:MAG: RNA polymerase sigma factor (TIGR02999 family) [Bermanella sp.]|jgi:RNA polymerase sigma factor (TIGR02999 family)